MNQPEQKAAQPKQAKCQCGHSLADHSVVGNHYCMMGECLCANFFAAIASGHDALPVEPKPEKPQPQSRMLQVCWHCGDSLENRPYGVGVRGPIHGTCYEQLWPHAAEPAPGVRQTAENWRDLPVGSWFFCDSPNCTNRYSVQERTSSGCTLICSTSWHHERAKRDMQEIAKSHNQAHAAASQAENADATFKRELEQARLRNCNALICKIQDIVSEFFGGLARWSDFDVLDQGVALIAKENVELKAKIAELEARLFDRPNSLCYGVCEFARRMEKAERERDQAREALRELLGYIPSSSPLHREAVRHAPEALAAVPPSEDAPAMPQSIAAKGPFYLALLDIIHQWDIFYSRLPDGEYHNLGGLRAAMREHRHLTEPGLAEPAAQPSEKEAKPWSLLRDLLDVTDLDERWMPEQKKRYDAVVERAEQALKKAGTK